MQRVTRLLSPLTSLGGILQARDIAQMVQQRPMSSGRTCKIGLMGLLVLSACLRGGYDEVPAAGTPTPPPGPMCGNGRSDDGEACDIAIAAGEPGACPASCAAAQPCERAILTGSECGLQCLVTQIEQPHDADGCCPAGADFASDSDCSPLCGNARIDGSEACDIAIAVGKPGACPSACASVDPCERATLSGSNCEIRCTVIVIDRPLDADGCCPTGADFASDNDCPQLCGNGQVDEAESCDVAIAAGEVGACPAQCTSAAPCERADLSGKECGLRCAVTVIDQPQDADGCCPTGADFASDSDCAQLCGNGMLDPGEACDGEATCGPDCLPLFHPALIHRYRFDGSGTLVRDAVGGASGRVVGTALDGSGDLVLAGGTSDQYVDLPNGIISILQDVTVEAWVTWTNALGVDHERIFDFGTSGNGENQQGGRPTAFLFMTPSLDSNALPHVGYSPDGSKTNRQSVDGAVGSFPVNVMTHVAVVFSGASLSMSMYIDGAQIGSSTVNGRLSALVDNNNWLGRSQFGGDAEFGGTLHEFRIYDQALSATAIARSFYLGPEP